MIKKLLCLLGICLATTNVNASDFECTLDKVAYIVALEPLVPKLIKDFKKDDFEAVYKVERDLKKFTSKVYASCESIKSIAELEKVINELSLGVIKFKTAQEEGKE